jgi:isoquinoline 1-oxidoreductase beta subunit
MEHNPDFSRRAFLRQAGLSGIALTLGCYLPAIGKSVVQIVHADDVTNAATTLMSWISIDDTGQVTIFNHRSEMGQGTWQSIPQIIAEELEVDMDQISIRYAAADPQKYGPQPQEGSFSIRGWYQQLLRTGATAREMLIEAAAKQWGVNITGCYAENGHVIHRSTGKKLSYGALVRDAAQLSPPQHVTLKERKDYKIIGRSLHRNDTVAKTNGSAVFGLDKKLPGMLYAVVERSPRFRGKVKSFDDSATRSVSGVKHVFKVQRVVFGLMYEGVAVVADSLWTAIQARKLLKVEWNDDGFEHLDSAQLFSRMRQDLYKPLPSAAFESALKHSSATIECIYEMPYQSHSCMEPLNCIADVKENSIEIWGPIQEANWIQADLSERLNVPRENVTVNMTFLGGGFGRKAFPDYPLEAALISKEIKAPVQVMWTREDDMAMGPFRSGALYRCRGGVDVTKKISALQIISAGQPMGPGEGGVAITECFGSMVGQVVKVSYQQDKKVRIEKVFALIDCGWYVNPDIIRAQVEGSIVMALGAAVNHATHFTAGKAVEKNFSTYPMPRINEIPEIEVHIMENDEKPGGVGEPGLPAFAPALCNAIFDLTGKRIRKLPFKLEDV